MMRQAQPSIDGKNIEIKVKGSDLKCFDYLPYFMRNQVQLILRMEGGIYAPRDFALSEPILHQKFYHFIHIKYDKYVGHRKGQKYCRSNILALAAKMKFLA